MRVVDRNFIPSSVADMALMQAELSGNAFVTFADLRSNVVPFASLNDGELSQIAVDAGFVVTED